MNIDCVYNNPGCEEYLSVVECGERLEFQAYQDHRLETCVTASIEDEERLYWFLRRRFEARNRA